METKDLLEVLKWWNSDRFKSLQRKLTTASNTIRKEALSREFRPFLNDDEIDTLEKATAILSGVKSKVEHAKEIKARKEREWKLKMDSLKAERKALVDANIAKEGRDLFLFRLALGLHHRDFSGHYFAENHYIISTLNRVLDPNHHFKIKALYRDCLDDLEKWFIEDSALWPYDEKPTPEELQALISRYQDEWRTEVLALYKDDVEKYDHFYMINAAENVVRLKAGESN